MSLEFDVLALHGLEPMPAQVWGGIRLVPLIRPEVRGDLRIGLRGYDALSTAVDLGGRPGAPGKRVYQSYVPHGLVVGWTKDGAEVVGETMLGPPSARKKRDARVFNVLHRMIKREQRGSQSRLRFLPLHASMEAYLTLHIGGPDIAWPHYSERVLRSGLLPRAEWSISGHAVPELAEALGLFEIHEGQCGVLIFVGGELASATVVSHPADYRRMHRALLDDFYGAMIYWYGRYAWPTPPATVRLDAEAVHDWASLRAELGAARARWGQFEMRQAGGLIGRAVAARRAYSMGPFDLLRFDTGFDEHVSNHLGEAIVREDGTLEYLKTYRLNRGQCRRGFLLRHLARHQWSVRAASAALNQTVRQFAEALKLAELGWILRARLR